MVLNLTGAAVERIQAQVAHSPQSPDARFLPARIHLKQGYCTDGEQVLNGSLPEYPQDADVLHHPGLAEFEGGDFDVTQDSLEQAITLEPRHALADQARRILKKRQALTQRRTAPVNVGIHTKSS